MARKQPLMTLYLDTHKQGRKRKHDPVKILAFIDEWISSHGDFPTFRVIMRASDVTSTSVMSYIMRSLLIQGELERDDITGRYRRPGTWVRKPPEAVE